MEEVDAAIKEVNELLGELDVGKEVPSGAAAAAQKPSLLCVERRCVRS